MTDATCWQTAEIKALMGLLYVLKMNKLEAESFHHFVSERTVNLCLFCSCCHTTVWKQIIHHNLTFLDF